MATRVTSPKDHFLVFYSSLCLSLQAILNGFLYEFPHDVRKCTEAIVGAAVEIYGRMSTDLLPTPAKSHYVFNLRDLSKCVQGKNSSVEFQCCNDDMHIEDIFKDVATAQYISHFFMNIFKSSMYSCLPTCCRCILFILHGCNHINSLVIFICPIWYWYDTSFCLPLGILQADPGIIRDAKQIFRLFCHEALRVFHDRLINHEDKNYFYSIMSEMANKHFGEVCRKTLI